MQGHVFVIAKGASLKDSYWISKKPFKNALPFKSESRLKSEGG